MMLLSKELTMEQLEAEVNALVPEAIKLYQELSKMNWMGTDDLRNAIAEIIAQKYTTIDLRQFKFSSDSLRQLEVYNRKGKEY